MAKYLACDGCDHSMVKHDKCFQCLTFAQSEKERECEWEASSVTWKNIHIKINIRNCVKTLKMIHHIDKYYML